VRRRFLPDLTDGEVRALLTAASYYVNDADPAREGDLASVPAQEWKALERARSKLHLARETAGDATLILKALRYLSGGLADDPQLLTRPQRARVTQIIRRLEG
jgi:hypothetical protein